MQCERCNKVIPREWRALAHTLCEECTQAMERLRGRVTAYRCKMKHRAPTPHAVLTQAWKQSRRAGGHGIKVIKVNTKHPRGG